MRRETIKSACALISHTLIALCVLLSPTLGGHVLAQTSLNVGSFDFYFGDVSGDGVDDYFLKSTVIVPTLDQAFIQSDNPADPIVIEAEHYQSIHPTNSGQIWEAITDPAYAGDTAMQVESVPGAEVNIKNNYAQNSTGMEYRIFFKTTGTYTAWIRGAGPESSSNSMHLGLNGVEIPIGRNLVGFGGNNSLRWASRQGGTQLQITFDVSQPGINILNLWMREDGLIVDKILLTTDPAYQPTGVGSEETPIAFEPTKTAAPSIIPHGGVYQSPLSITMETVTPGASIFFELDGSDPTTDSMLYDSPLTIDSSTTAKAFATADGLLDSDITIANFLVGLGNDAAISYRDGDNLLIDGVGGFLRVWRDPVDTSGLQLLDYEIFTGDFSGEGTTDLFARPKVVTDPLTNFILYGSPTNTAVSVQFLNSFNIFDFNQGEIEVQDYNADGRDDLIVVTASGDTLNFGSAADGNWTQLLPTIAAPTIAVDGDGPLTVTLSTVTPEVDLFYTLDGSVPSTSSTLYTGPFQIDSGSSIKVIGISTGFNDSVVTTGELIECSNGTLTLDTCPLIANSGAAILNFSDLVNGPDTGLADGLGSGAIVTVWGQNIGDSQGSSTLEFCDSADVCRTPYIYYWKRADGSLPSGPADLWASHRMQEIAFSVPDSADGLGTIRVTVDGNISELPFTVRPGSIYHVMPSGSDSNAGTFNAPFLTVDEAVDDPSPVGPGSIVYIHNVDTGSTTTNRAISISNNAASSTADAQFALVSYPGYRPTVTGANAITNSSFEGSISSKLDVYSSNFTATVNVGQPGGSQLSVTAIGIETDKFGRVIGNRITDFANGCSSAFEGAIFGDARYEDDVSEAKIFGNEIYEYGCPGSSHSHRTTDIAVGSNGANLQVPAWEFGWNYLHDNDTKFGINSNDSGSGCGDLTSTLKIHDNVIVNQSGAGIAVGSTCGWSMDVEINNNVLINVGLANDWDGVDPTSGSEAENAAISIRDSGFFSQLHIFDNTVIGWATDGQGGTRSCIGLQGSDDNVVIQFNNNICQSDLDLPTVNFGFGGGDKLDNFTGASNIFHYTGGVAVNLVPPAWDAAAATSSPNLSIMESQITVGEGSASNSGDTNAARDIYGNLRTSPNVGAIETVEQSPTLTVQTPTISPDGGTFPQPQTVSLATDTAGASLFYTLDGSTPSSASTLFTGDILVDATATLRVIGILAGQNDSDIASAIFTIESLPPTLNLASSATRVEEETFDISVSASDPDTGAPSLSVVGGLPGSATFTDNGNGSGRLLWTTSVGDAGTYALTVRATDVLDASLFDEATITLTVAPKPTVAKPTITPNGGVFTVPQSVTLATTTAGASLFYTLDGSEPNSGSIQFTGEPISVDGTTALKVIGILAGHIDSAIAAATFTIENLPPVITVDTAATVVEDEPFDIPVSASDPDTGTPLLSVIGPLPGTAAFIDNGDGSANLQWVTQVGDAGTYIVTVRATDAVDSTQFVDATITLAVEPKPSVATPTITPNGGTFLIPQLVELATATAGASLFYTLDGTAPTSASLPYIAGTPILIEETATLRVVGILEGYINSESEPANFVIQNLPPTLTWIGDEQVTEEETFDLLFIAIDPDSGNPILSVVGDLPDTATFTDNGDGTGRLTWATQVGDAGSFDVAIVASDAVGGNQSAPAIITLVVLPKPIVATPTITPNGGTFPVPQLVELATATAGASLFYTLDGTSPTALSLPYTVGEPILIEETTTLRVIGILEGHIDSESEQTNFTIQNLPPILVLDADATVTEGEAFDISVVATDPDTGTPVLSVVDALPGTASFVNNGDGSGNLQWNTVVDDAGTYMVTVRAADALDSNLFAEQTITLTVNAAPGNGNEVVLFSETFDGQADWQPDQNSGETPLVTPPANWSFAFDEDDTGGAPNIQISAAEDRSGGGKALILTEEHGTSPGSDGSLGVDLANGGESEIFVSMWVKFEDGWQIGANDTNMLMLRALHYDGTGDRYAYGSGGNSGPIYQHSYEHNSFGVRNRHALRCDPQETNYTCGNPALSGWPQGPSFAESSVNYTNHAVENIPGVPTGGIAVHADVWGNSWHKVEFQLSLNSAPGMADGILRYWFDGFLILENTQIGWLGDGADATNKWNYIAIGGASEIDFGSAGDEQSYAIDDFQICTERCPPIGGAPRVSQPVVTPNSASFVNSQIVEISSATIDASIFYTLNGAEPTVADIPYTGPFTVNTTATVKAIAVKGGLTDSLVTTESFTMENLAPTFNAPDSVPAIIEGDTLDFLVMATDANTDSPPPIVEVVAGLPATANAIISNEGNGNYRFTWTTAIGEANSYTVTLRATDALDATQFVEATTTLTVDPKPIVATPTITPSGGDFFEPQSVSLATATAGATLFYTLDGTIPDSSSNLFTGAPILIENSATLRVVGILAGHIDSAIEEAQFNILQNLPPMLSATSEVVLTEGESLDIPVSATDPDTGTPALSVIGALPGTASFVNNGDGSGNLQWNTVVGDVGSYMVTVRAADALDSNLFVEGTITVTVNAASGGADEVVLFFDNFDDQADWQPDQNNGETPLVTPPTNWSFAFNDGDSGGAPNIQISAAEDLNGSGKALILTEEHGASSGSDGSIGVDLANGGESEIFVSMWVKFEDSWQLGSSITEMFMLRALHYNGSGDRYVYAQNGHSAPIYFHSYKHDAFGVRNHHALRCDPQETNYTCGNPALSGWPQGPNSGESSVNYTSHAIENIPGVPTDGIAVHGDVWGNSWHKVEFQLTMNSAPGVADGILRYWFDGFLILENTQIGWLGDGADAANKWNYVALGGASKIDFGSAGDEQSYAIDDFQICTERCPETVTTPQVETPVISPAGGSFPDGETVTVSLTTGTPGADIFYTLDGTEPSGESILYTGPFSISDTTTVRAIAALPGLNNSEFAQQEFVKEAVSNQAPTIAGLPTMPTVVEGSAFNFTFSATDPDTNSRAVIEASGLPANASILPEGLDVDGIYRLTWATQVGDQGEFPVIITAKDDAGGADAEETVILKVNPTSTNDIVIFSENFDNQADWQPEHDSGEFPVMTPPPGWSAVYNDGDLGGEPNMQISGMAGRGGSGKAFISHIHSRSSGEGFQSDGILGFDLPGEGEAEIFVQFYVMYQPGWRFELAGANSQTKMFRALHYDKQGDRFEFFTNGNSAPIYLYDYQHNTFGVRHFHTFRCDPQESNYDCNGERFAGLPRDPIAGSGAEYTLNYNQEPVEPIPGVAGLPVANHDDVFVTTAENQGWHKLEFQLVMNSQPDVADGTFRYWLNDILIVETNAVRWQGLDAPGGLKFNFVAIGGNSNLEFGAPGEEQWYAIDDFQVCTERCPDIATPPQVEIPIISPAGGSFPDGDTVTVTLTTGTTGADIFYTVDGTDPTSGSLPYTGPFSVSNTTTVKAIAILDGLVASELAQETFIKDAPDPNQVPIIGGLPTILTLEEGDTFDFTFSAIDPDTDSRAIIETSGLPTNASILPEGLDADGIYRLTWATQVGDQGQFPVVITAKDDTGGTDTVSTVTLEVNPASTSDSVIFSENFDAQPDWQPEHSSGEEPTIIPPPGWSHVYNAGDAGNEPNIRIVAGEGRGGFGKALISHVESAIDASSGRPRFTDDGMLRLTLPNGGESRLFASMWVKFQPGWNPGIQGFTQVKMFRVGHWDGNLPVTKFFTDGTSAPIYIYDYAHDTYGARNFHAMRCDPQESDAPQGDNYLCTNPQLTGWPQGPHQGDSSVNYTSHAIEHPDGLPTDGLAAHDDVWGTDWHKLEFEVVMNSAPGVADGILRYWFDGFKILENTQIGWLGEGATAGLKWNFVAIGGNSGIVFGPDGAEQWYAIDDFKVCTERCPD